MAGILWNRVVWSLVLLCCLLQAGIVLRRQIVEEESLGLVFFVPLLIGATIASIWADQRKGFFEAGKLGPASAISFVAWCLFLLGVLIIGTPSAGGA